MAPYIKHIKFEGEQESRIAFSNNVGKLAKCIRFRTSENGIKIPYIVVKAGDLGRNLSSCLFDASEESIRALVDDITSKNPIGEIWIPQGSNQEIIYYKVSEIVQELNRKDGGTCMLPFPKIRVFCEGHLPIRRIVVAPTYDRKRIAEAVKRFCQTKYWLRDVDVSASEIPYASPLQ